MIATGAPDDPRAHAAAPLLADRPMRDGFPTAYACSGFTCREPVSDPDALISVLRGA
jgi:uncharacterized protein YyaL (SSP411 family)